MAINDVRGPEIRLHIWFLICQSIGFVGVSGASLVLTTLAFDAGEASGHPAMLSGIVLALIAIFAVFAVPYGPVLTRKLGLRRAYAFSCSAFAMIYILGGVAIAVVGKAASLPTS